jgi:hypothetical protein
MPKVKTSPTSAARKTLYSVHPGVVMVQQWIEDLPKKTGRSLEQWIDLVKAEGPPSENERRDWLKTEHGLGTNSAWWLAERAEGKGLEDGDPETYLRAAEVYVAEMYAGPKRPLKPIHDRLLELGFSMGDDVKACPCKTIVPLYRKHVFAQIKPSTRTRIDFGFALGNLPGQGRLIDTGGFAKKDRITHRIAITSLADIDAEVESWLRTAYEKD